MTDLFTHPFTADLLYCAIDTSSLLCVSLLYSVYSDTAYTAIQLYSVYIIHPDTPYL